MSELSVTTPSDREIVLRRDFQAPSRLVFRALTEPDLLRRWYGAQGWHLVVCEVDLRVGGAWRFVSRGPDAAELGQGGEYRTITPPGRLGYTEMFDNQSYPGPSLIDHELTDHLERTTLTTTIRFATPEGRDTVLRYPMTRGAGEGFDRLDALLASVNGDLR